MKKKTKVHCGRLVAARIGEGERLAKNCVYFKIINIPEGGEMYQCIHISNIGNALAADIPNIPPHEKNVNCDCAYFRQFKESPKEAVHLPPDIRKGLGYA